jgi:hypothetical protein
MNTFTQIERFLDENRGPNLSANMIGILEEAKTRDLSVFQYYKAVEMGRIGKVWVMPWSGGMAISFGDAEEATHLWSDEKGTWKPSSYFRQYV